MQLRPLVLLASLWFILLLSFVQPAHTLQCYGYTTTSTSNSVDPPYLPAKECEGCATYRKENEGNLSALTWRGYMEDSPQDCRDALNYAEVTIGGAGELSDDDCYAIVNCSKMTTFDGEEDAESYNGFPYTFNPPDDIPAYRCWWQDDGFFANGACFEEFEPEPANASQAELEEVSTASFNCKEELCNARMPEGEDDGGDEADSATSYRLANGEGLALCIFVSMLLRVGAGEGM